MTIEKKNIKDAILLSIITWISFEITPIILLLFNIRSNLIIVASVLIIILTICLAFFKRLYLIKNSLSLRNDELKITFFFIVMAILMGGIIFLLKRNFAPTSFDELLFTGVNSLAEELYFRVAILGILIERFSFVKYKIYWTKKGDNISVLIVFILFTSIFFALLHNEWSKFVIRSIHGILFSFLFIATNKKIYAPGLFHYIINLSVPPEM